MSTIRHHTELLVSTDDTSRLSPAGRAMGLTTDDCAALRRHAMRLEAAADYGLALDAYRMATVVDPTQAGNWFGLARCYRHVGDQVTADRIEVCARIIQERLS